jgi:hypothetical protein
MAERATAEEFYGKAGHIPDSAAEWVDQQETYRAWRADPRFELHWPLLDRLLALDFAAIRRWAAAARAAENLRGSGYDFDAWREQRKYDLRQAHHHAP